MMAPDALSRYRHSFRPAASAKRRPPEKKCCTYAVAGAFISSSAVPTCHQPAFFHNRNPRSEAQRLFHIVGDKDDGAPGMCL
ncbi:Uncharacterised protein [Raoultella planticola]|nr:Uncharacterised protein [Raoultella planticola]